MNLSNNKKPAVIKLLRMEPSDLKILPQPRPKSLTFHTTRRRRKSQKRRKRMPKSSKNNRLRSGRDKELKR
jgi:hypothetical protein